MSEPKHEMVKRRLAAGESAVALAAELGITRQCVYIMNQYKPTNGKRGRKPRDKEATYGQTTEM